jgi:hypothetical protein
VEVHYGAAEVGFERFVCPQMRESTDASDEGLVNEVLGLRSVTGQQERQPHGRRHVAGVELGQRSLARMLHGELRTPVHH